MNVNQQEMPLVEALLKHAGRQPGSLHVPGHKNGQVMHPAGRTIFSSVLPYDQTELTGLDDLHEPKGVIAAAQHLAANFYGVAATLFLVGGSTAGNLTMILAAFQRGDTVLVQRDVHKSIIHGLRLAGVQPVFIFPRYDKETQLSLGLTLTMTEDAFSKYPNAKGLIINSPSYYGWAPPLSSIIQAAHKRRAKVLVDEAHGAHFKAGTLFPSSAIDEGADVVVQSAHKTLPALTMGAYLHQGKNSSVSLDALKEASSMVQSSSPSYPVMASLDIARHYLYTIKNINDEKLMNHYTSMRKEIITASGLCSVTPPCNIAEDPLKFILKAPKGYSGWMLQQYMEEENVFIELADHRHVLLILPLTLDPLPIQTGVKIRRAVDRMTAELKVESRVPICMPPFGIHRIEGEWSVMFHVKQKKVPVEQVKQKKAATDIIPYPPGIPLFFKGEMMKGERYDFLVDWLKQGGSIHGGEMDSSGTWYINIICEEGNQ